MRDDELKRLLRAKTPPALPQSFYQGLLDRLSKPASASGHVNTGGVLARLGGFSLRDAAIVFVVVLIGAIAWHQFATQEDELHRIDTLSMTSLFTL